jgi:hypothetical protein
MRQHVLKNYDPKHIAASRVLLSPIYSSSLEEQVLLLPSLLLGTIVHAPLHQVAES